MSDNPEQELVNRYVEYLKCTYKNVRIINANCKKHKYADLELILDDVLWIIESKCHKSKNAYNSIHLLFGELLKETGRQRHFNNDVSYNEIKYGLLIPGNTYGYTNKPGIDFYKKHFKEIDKNKYLEFGKLIPIDDIFIFNTDNNEFIHKTWNEFIED